MAKRADLMAGALGEGGLVLAIAAIAYVTHEPLLFASLGPTAYEQVETPTQKSARLWNVMVGHFIALAAGFFALWVLGTWAAPKVTVSSFVPAARMWTATLAATITAVGCLLAKASQPAALSTTLLVSLGSMQTERDALAIIAGVLLIGILGEPVRRFRVTQKESEQGMESSQEPRAA